MIKPNLLNDPIRKAAEIARLADAKKAEDILVLDLRGVCQFTDAFVVCTGDSSHQLAAIARNISDGLRQEGVEKPIADGLRQSSWTVLDYGDVVVHIMDAETRSYYRLEDLWGDGEEVNWSAASKGARLVAAGPIAQNA